jgi:DNA adenine methylase
MLGPLSYIGGKRALAKRIIELMPEHKTYVEAFAGGAQVFFHKPRSEVEVLNDLDHEIVNFFRVCQNHHEELVRYLRFTIVSRGQFDLLRKTGPEGLTDIQRAARYLYILKNSFASLVRNPTYHWHVVHPPGFNPEKLPEIIHNTHRRLARVQIEELPYDKIIRNFDRPSTFFFLDPPYFGKKLYHYNFETKDFEHLAEVLRTVKGKFLLTLNDVPEVRKIFRHFRMQSVELAYTTQKHAGRRYREVFIMNFTPPRTKGGPEERPK